MAANDQPTRPTTVVKIGVSREGIVLRVEVDRIKVDIALNPAEVIELMQGFVKALGEHERTTTSTSTTTKKD